MKKMSRMEKTIEFIKRNNIEDEDLQQELFLSAIESGDSSNSVFYKRMYKVVKNYELKNTEDEFCYLLSEFLFDVPDMRYNPEVIIINNFTNDSIMSILDKREIYVINKIIKEGKNYCELSKELDISNERVRRILHMALIKLRKQFNIFL